MRLLRFMYVFVFGCLLLLNTLSSAVHAELVGYWPLDEGMGDTVSDASGNDLTGYLVGDIQPQWIDGRFGGGLSFNRDEPGEDIEAAHVRIPDESGVLDQTSNANIEKLRFTTDDSFTAMAWVHIPEDPRVNWQGVVTKGRDTSPTAWWGLWVDSESHWAYGHNGNHLRGGTLDLDPVTDPPYSNAWTHFAIQQNAEQETLSMYINGEEVGVHEGLEPQESPGDLIFAGAGGTAGTDGGGCCDGEWFVGGIDEVRVYNTALSIEEIQAAMAGPPDMPPMGGQLEIAEELFINLDAQGLADGALASWPNTGTTSGDFIIGDLDEIGPFVEVVGGNRAVSFEDMASMTGPIPDASLVGEDPTRSIEVWAFQPEIEEKHVDGGQGEEVMVSWGKRGGPVGSVVQFNYGDHSNFGAATHWGGDSTDIGWIDNTSAVDVDLAGAPEEGVWHHLVYTYDGETTRVYSDGVLWNEEELGAGVVNTEWVDQPIRLGAAVQADEETLVLHGSLAMAQVRIHGGVLTAEQIMNNFTCGITCGGDGGDPLAPLNDGSLTDPEARTTYVHDVLGTWVGDSNVDGEFNSGDLVAVFQAGEYEDGVAGNSGWATGDWTGDGEFDTGDLVFAFQDGGFEQGPRGGGVAAVPEPSSLALILMGFLCFGRLGRSSRP